jgi:VWFA-related protein
MIRLLPIAALLLTATASAQQPAPEATPQSTITVRSTLVLIPTLVKTKQNQLVYTLTPDDFLATDDGVPQKLTLDADAGAQPLALVIVVETGGDGAQHLENYQHLAPLLDNLLGAVEHKVAVVGFDSHPTLLHGFTPNTSFIEHSLDDLATGDNGSDSGDAILDAITFAVGLLRQQPTTYRRAILLLSETIDHGSQTSLVDALHAVSDTNTAIYAVGFNSTRAAIAHEAGGLSSSEPGPAHGCFSRDFGLDADGNPVVPPTSRGEQNYNCFAELVPPLRLARMAEIAFRNALAKNTPETVARLTGGEYFKFSDTRNLDRDLLTIANHVPNRYVLSFHPLNPHPGFHTLTLTLKDRPNLKVYARNGYWVDDAP